MLRLERIAGNQISGLQMEELDFLNDILLEDDTDTIYNQYTGLPAELNLEEKNVGLNAVQLEEILRLEDEAKSKSTEKQTTHYIKMLTKFLQENKLMTNLTDMPKRYLESYLRLFFTRIRKANGDHYSVASLCGMRAAFHRHFQEIRHMELIGNPDFCNLEKTYKASLAASLKDREKSISGGGSGYPPIEPVDMEKLRAYFTRSDPQKLQDEILFLLVYHFGFRGREWLRSLERSSVVISVNNDEKIVDLLRTTKEKNVKVGNEKSVKQIIMAEIPDNSSICPVAAMELYLSKISKLPGNALFPKHKIKWTQEEWYCKAENLGKNSLNDFMKNISKRARLSKLYTNHSIRPTVVTTLKRQGFSDEACMAVTGHKTKENVARYDKRSPNERMTILEKKTISKALTSGLHVQSDVLSQISVTSSNDFTHSTNIVSTIAPVDSKSYSFSAPSNKKMKICADGENNMVTITFE